MSMADRIVVLNRGNIEHCAPPVEIYDRPRTLFVNQFVGTTNLLPVKVVDLDASGATVRFGDVDIPCAGPSIMAPGLAPGADAIWSIRPLRHRGRSIVTPRRSRPTTPISR